MPNNCTPEFYNRLQNADGHRGKGISSQESPFDQPSPPIPHDPPSNPKLLPVIVFSNRCQKDIKGLVPRKAPLTNPAHPTPKTPHPTQPTLNYIRPPNWMPCRVFSNMCHIAIKGRAPKKAPRPIPPTQPPRSPIQPSQL